MADPDIRPLNVFVSYRREDAQLHARFLAKELRQATKAEVFIDIESVGLGEDFQLAIEREVAHCDVALIVIGDQWLEGKSGAEARRIDDVTDWCRLEVEAALKRDVPVVPILVEGAKMPGPDKLPESIRALAFMNGRELRSDDGWDDDIRKLIAGLPAPAVQVGAAPGGADTGSTKEKRERASIDFVAAQEFIDSIPSGRWASYLDASLAGGSPTGAMAVGQWLMSKGEAFPNVWKILNNKGEVGSGWAPSDPTLPPTADAVRERLASEGIAIDASGRAEESKRWSVEDAADAGVGLAELPETKAAETGRSDTLIVAARRAYPDYLLSASYICQPGRSFREEIEFLGFYAGREIKPHVAKILHRRDQVELSQTAADRLLVGTAPFDREVAELIKLVLDPTAPWMTRRDESSDDSPGPPLFQIFLLSDQNSPETIRLPTPIHHDGKNAWTQSQRYTSLDQLRAGPASTENLH